MTREYDWNSIEVIITPDVLLVYYLYLRGLDQKAKKMGATKKDEGNIIYYYQALGRSEVPSVSKTTNR